MAHAHQAVGCDPLGCVASVRQHTAHLVARLQMQVAHDGACKAGCRPAGGGVVEQMLKRASRQVQRQAAAAGDGHTEQPLMPLRSPVLKSLEALKVLARPGARRRRGLSAGLGQRRHSAPGAPGRC